MFPWKGTETDQVTRHPEKEPELLHQKQNQVFQLYHRKDHQQYQPESEVFEQLFGIGDQQNRRVWLIKWISTEYTSGIDYQIVDGP